MKISLPASITVTREAYAPDGSDDFGLPVVAWSAPEQVKSHGWWQPTADDIKLYPGRRADVLARILLLPNGAVCADRDRWTLPGDGTYSQDGEAQDYSHGPFGTVTPLVVYLSRTEG